MGTFTVTCTATDRAGNTSTATASYQVTYGVCIAAGDKPGAKKSGSTIPVKITLCDAAGNEVGSKDLAVIAVSITGPGGTMPAQDSGNANAGGLLRYAGNKYLFNLTTKDLAPGDYTFDFTVAGDPVIHHVQFTIMP